MSPVSVSAKERVAILKSARQKNNVVTFGVIAMVVLVALAWFGASVFRLDNNQIFPNLFGGETERDGLGRLLRFFAEATPKPIRNGEGLGQLVAWTEHLLLDSGLSALFTTLCVSIIAAWLAGVCGIASAFFTARRAATSSPNRFGKLDVLLRTAARLALIVLRSVPDLIWAFLILAVFGATAWTGILALALHNGGILGKLGSELIEARHTPAAPALNALGAHQTQIDACATAPDLFNAYLVHWLYRWECCARDAVILGMIGLPSIGYWIFQESWPRLRYDEVMFFACLGAVLVFFTHAVSQSVLKTLQMTHEDITGG